VRRVNLSRSPYPSFILHPLFTLIPTDAPITTLINLLLEQYQHHQLQYRRFSRLIHSIHLPDRINITYTLKFLHSSVSLPLLHSPNLNIMPTDNDKGPMNMFVLSVGALQSDIPNQTPGYRWERSPPLFQHKGVKANKIRTLKKMCRKGIPPELRLAIWLISTVRIARPNQTIEETYEYGVMGKVEVLSHGWDIILDNLFPHDSDKEGLTIPPNFESSPNEIREFLTKTQLNEQIFEKGVYKILHAAIHQLGIEYCPLLPAITTIFLSAMPECHAYSAIREMSNTADYYFPISKIEHFKWCKTFADLTRKSYRKTAIAMEACGALTPSGLDPIFRRFFITILKREHVLRIMDMYAIEGYKTLLRVGIMIITECREYMTVIEFKNVDAFWKGVHRVAHSDNFDIDFLIKQTYGKSKIHSRQAFPTRKFITRLMEHNEEWAEKYSSTQYSETNQRPLGFVKGDIPIKLAEQSCARLTLAEFLPFALKNTKIELIYSSNEHGRTLSNLYRHCAVAKHTIMLMEILQTGATIGMFATDTWQSNRNVYGDGGCMLFRLSPDPACYHWSNSDDLERSDSNKLISEVLRSQFMISKADFIAMGSNEDGLNGLRLNEDLTIGSSARACGFNNEPLAGEEYPDFDIGLIEVYRFVREIDGKPVDGEEDVWKGMFD